MALPSNEQIIDQLRTAALLLQDGEHYTLDQAAIDEVLGRLNEEEKQLIYWTKVVQYKCYASTCSGVLDYLSKEQLNGLSPYEEKLYLNEAERAFIEQSREANKRIFLWGCLSNGLLGIVLLCSIGLAISTNNKKEKTVDNTAPSSILLEQLNDRQVYYLYKQKDEAGIYRYGFVHADRQIAIPCVYDEATPFNRLGLARVREGNTWYYIDENNQRYPLALSVKDLNESIRALELSNQGLTQLPSAVYHAKELRILNLRNNKLKQLDEKLTALENLTKLDLSGNELEEVPTVLEKMKRLKEVNLAQNPIQQPVVSSTTALTIHFGGNRMRPQIHESKYGKRSKKEAASKTIEPFDRTIPVFEEEEIAVVDDMEAKTIDKEEPLEKEKPASKAKRVVLEGFKTLIKQQGIEWKYKLQPYGEQYKLLVMMVLQTNRLSSNIIPKPTTKMIFVSGFERQVYNFEFDSEPIVLDKQKGYLNACILEKKHLQWMKKNLITQMRLFDVKKDQAYMYNTIHGMRYEWKTYVTNFLDQH